MLRQEELTTFLVYELLPYFWHKYPDINCEFLALSLLVKADKNLLIPEGTLFPELDSKWTSPVLRQNPNIVEFLLSFNRS